MEDQAIQRVHRIGQTRQVLVYRFLVKSTVSSPLLQHSPPFAVVRSPCLTCLSSLLSPLPRSVSQVEERILALQQRKKFLAGASLGMTADEMKQVRLDDLKALFKES